MSKLLTILFCVSVFSAHGQEGGSVYIFFQNEYEGKSVNIPDTGFTVSDDLKINVLKYYISNLRLYSKGVIVAKHTDIARLIDASDTSTLSIIFPLNKSVVYDEIRFDLGVDSTTNVSGVMGGDLDPTKGMYWTWQSGYINFKLEGHSNLCTNPKKEFAYHIGGYTPPYLCLQEVSLKTKGKQKHVIYLDLQSIINQIKFDSLPNIMSPSHNAVLFSKLIQSNFTVKEP